MSEVGKSSGGEPKPGKGALAGKPKVIEKLYIASGGAVAVVVLLIGLALLGTLPVQARPFLVEQAVVALATLAGGGLLSRSLLGKLRLARARASIEAYPPGFIEEHSHGKSLRADGEFESLTARMSILCRLHSIVSSSFADTLSSYLKLYESYEPNSQRWKQSVRELDEQVRKKLARKPASNDKAVRRCANEGGSEGEVPAEDLLIGGADAGGCEPGTSGGQADGREIATEGRGQLDAAGLDAAHLDEASRDGAGRAGSEGGGEHERA